MRVAVLFGGRSGEHEVSVASARSVIAAMDDAKYKVVPVAITKEGRWLAGPEAAAALEAGQVLAPQAIRADEQDDAALVPAGYQRELVPGMRDGFPEVDIVFPLLHGTYGEDGTVQGLLELADLPYVGAGVLGSALGMDKVAMKAVLTANGLPVVEYLAFSKRRWAREGESVIAQIEARFEYPVFVKPANMGSSVGISKAHDRAELRYGLDLAARFDRRILVERAIHGRELECSVLGNDEPLASVVGEVVPCNEFYDYRAKYVDEGSLLHIPADIPQDVAEAIRDMALKAFLALDCAGMARADFFLCQDTGRVYINELNTIPGFTNISMYPKLWEASGLPYPQLIDRLIELGLERHREKETLERSYGFDH